MKFLGNIISPAWRSDDFHCGVASLVYAVWLLWCYYSYHLRELAKTNSADLITCLGLA